MAISITPVLGDNARSSVPYDPGRNVIGYEYARIHITYGINGQAIAVWPDGIPVPPKRPGTWLELRLVPLPVREFRVFGRRGN